MMKPHFRELTKSWIIKPVIAPMIIPRVTPPPTALNVPKAMHAPIKMMLMTKRVMSIGLVYRLFLLILMVVAPFVLMVFIITVSTRTESLLSTLP